MTEAERRFQEDLKALIERGKREVSPQVFAGTLAGAFVAVLLGAQMTEAAALRIIRTVWAQTIGARG